jgi:hypothetical protein
MTGYVQRKVRSPIGHAVEDLDRAKRWLSTETRDLDAARLVTRLRSDTIG